MTIHSLLVFTLSCCGFIAVSFGFWLLIARDEFIESCQRYASKDKDADTPTLQQ
jgi:hypothetical protein